MSYFCCLRTKLYVHWRGKYICNDSMQYSYTVCCIVILSWGHNEEQNLCIWKVAVVYTIVCPSSKQKHVSWHSIKRCTRLFATFDTAWLQNSCWCGYWLKKVGWITYLILAYLLNFSPHYIYMQFMFVHWAWCYFHIFNMKEHLLKAVMIIGT